VKLALLILAAGLSERMGALKPLLPVGETTALQRSLRLASAAGISDVYVVTGNRTELIEETLGKSDRPVSVVFNKAYKTGMFSSIKAGVAALPENADGFFLLPADICAVGDSTVKTLARAFESCGGAKIIYPTFSGKRGHPPLIPLRCTQSLGEYRGDDGLRGFLSGYPFLEVETGDAGILLDMDTPEDYARILRYLAYSPPTQLL
jgi:CTP:molybdopterin cytidylyltransferase MocA